MEEEVTDPLLLDCEKHKDWQAFVVFHGLPCEITYCESTDTITIAENHPSRDTARVLLNIPSFLILNVETQEECKERQQVRKKTDASVKNHFTAGMTELKVGENNTGNFSHGTLVYSRSHSVFCGFPPSWCTPLCNSNDDRLEGKGSQYLELLRSQSCEDHDDGRALNEDKGDPYSSPQSLLPSKKLMDGVFFLHYVKIDPSGKLRSLHSLQLLARSEEDVVRFHALMCRLLSRIYEKSAKNMLIFVSPVSGTGDAETVVHETLIPVLHFTRHTMQVIVTTRAHHCEDYIADLNNLINEHFVIVAVGGDGMIHEAVNGLHRRKLAFIRKLRETESQGEVKDTSFFTSTTSVDSKSGSGPFVRGKYLSKEDLLRGWDAIMPLVATVPSGSGCGLAKTLDEVHPLTAALGLIHCSTVTADLLYLRFIPNARLVSNHEAAMSRRYRRKIESKFRTYEDQNLSELKAHRDPDHDTALMPFLRNGEQRYDDPVSLHFGSPYFSERVAFMSLSYGMLNDVDRGSEHLRWMGNTRFAVYGCFCILRGPTKYKFKLRYLPWENKEKEVIEKIGDGASVSPSTSTCSNRASCSHCMEYNSVETRDTKNLENQKSSPKGITQVTSYRRNSTTCSSFIQERKRGRPTTVLENDSDLLEEAAVDFDDESLRWKVIEDEMYLVIICGIRNISRDVVMAPLAHICDGAMDIIFCRADPRYGRKEFLQLFSAVEKGTHLSLPFVNCVRVKAVEIEVQNGLIMADGEMMPMSRVRVTKLRRGVQYVRCNF